MYKFLLGLNKNLDEVRGRILGTKPLPNIREAFSKVCKEESRKKVMMGSQTTSTVTESSALAAHGTQYQPSDNRQRKGRPWCDHCRKPGHTRETCWKIHGKPADWKPTRVSNDRENRSNLASADEKSTPVEPTPFSKEQMEILQKMFHQSQQIPGNSTSMIGTGSLAQKGNFLRALNVKRKKHSPWIVDSGASDHMTGDATILDNYSPCNGDLAFRIADGSLSKVAGTGSVVISKDLNLTSVLLVPNLDCNLLSISKLTQEKSCVTKFFKTGCEFQDLDLGMTIGNA